MELEKHKAKLSWDKLHILEITKSTAREGLQIESNSIPINLFII